MFTEIGNSLTVAFTSNLCKLLLRRSKTKQQKKKIRNKEIKKIKKRKEKIHSVVLLFIITRALILVYMRMELGEDIFAA